MPCNDPLTPVSIQSSLEKPWDIMLKNGQSLVQLLQHSDHGVVLLHVLFGLLHGDLSVETPKEISNFKTISTTTFVFKCNF